MSTATVTVQGVDYEVEFDYTPYRAATYYDPAEGGEVDLISVSIGAYEISEHLADWVRESIAHQLESDIPEMMAEEAMDAAIRRAEDRRDEELYS